MKALEIEQLTKHYHATKAVDTITLTINQGELFGFVGPNGAGKSTTIKMLLNMIFPTSGTAKIFGMDCVKESLGIKKVTGYVSSDVRYYDGMTSQDIFNYVADFHQIQDSSQRIKQYLERFEIDAHKKIATLSLGNKKKVAIVSALIQQPKLLILDEPTNGLDPMMQHRLFETLEEQRQAGMTIFLSSHDLHEVQAHCDRAAFIKQGKIIALETISQELSGGKRISLTSPTVERAQLERFGATILKQTAETIDFLYETDFNQLLAYLASQDVKDIVIRHLELEDKFLSMYE